MPTKTAAKPAAKKAPAKVKVPRAHIDLYKVKKGGWKYEAFGGNSKTIGRADEPIKQRAYQARRAVRSYPGLPVFVLHEDGTRTPYEVLDF